jgi:hypothetical protein
MFNKLDRKLTVVSNILDGNGQILDMEISKSKDSDIIN